ncbi:MAG: putative Ig domain-containing protein, partial [Ignavibacteria bacterium]|nr:putative Ig domain-containing protein [Ignavibacteria bacterium]
MVDGNATSAHYKQAVGITIDTSGFVYVTDVHGVRKIAPDGFVVTIAGNDSPGYADGIGSEARFDQPTGIVRDTAGNLYVADAGNNRIRKITPSGIVSTLAGSGNPAFADGVGTNASFNNPQGLAIDASGNIYVADYLNHRIRKITPNGAVSTVVGSGGASGWYGSGAGTSANLGYPRSIAIDANNNLYVTIQNGIFRISPDGTFKYLFDIYNLSYLDGYAGDLFQGIQIQNSVLSLLPDSSGNLYIAIEGGISKLTSQGSYRITPDNATFTYCPSGCTSYPFATMFLGMARNSAGEIVATTNYLQRIIKLSNIPTCTPIPARYSDTVFAETALNDGAISSVRTITVPPSITKWSTSITNNSALNLGVHYSIANVPSGLTAVLTKLSDSVVAISFTGNASVHASTNSVTNVQITFLNASLENNNVGTVVGLNGRNLAINFISPYQAPSWVSQTPPLIADAGSAYNFTFGASGNPRPTYSVVSGTLPAGLTLNTVTGKLSGIPSVPNSYGPIVVGATNGTGSITSTPFTIVVSLVTPAPLWVAQTPPTTGTVGIGYSYTFIAVGSPTPTYSLESGTLPSGVSLDSVTGIISGTPTATGSYSFTVRANNSEGFIISSPLTITVNQAPSVFSAQTPPTYTVINTAYTPYTFVANGTPTPRYSLASGTLPTGLSLDPVSGTLSGTPTATGAFTFTVRASNVAGAITGTSTTITIILSPQAPNTFSVQTPSTTGIVGVSYPEYTFVADGMPTPTYTIANGALPSGLTLSSSGVLSGTPTTAGIFVIWVRASNNVGSIISSPIVITIYQAPSAITFYFPPTQSGTVGYPVVTSRFISSGSPTPTFSLASGTLPAGLTLSEDGFITGTPTVAGGHTYTVRASNIAGSVESAPFNIFINQGPSVFTSQGPLAIGVVGSEYAPYTFVANGTPAPTYYVSDGTFPPGLRFSGAGVLSGTPTAAGTYTFRVRAQNAGGDAYSDSVSITIHQAPNLFDYAQSPAAFAGIGTAYPQYTFVANGSPAPTYSVASGALPPGLTLTSGGILSGTPTAAGSYSFIVRASNSAGFFDSYSIPINITEAPSAFSAQSPSISGSVGSPYSSYTFVANGTPTPWYSIISGTLPPGLTLTYDGILSGTPTAAGAYTFAVQARSASGGIVYGSTTSNSITITITGAPTQFSAQSPPPNGAVGTSYVGYTFVANGVPVPTYSIASGTLPPGLSLSSAGVLSGTPTVVGSYIFSVRATNSGGAISSSPVSITIFPAYQAPSAFSAQTPATNGVIGSVYTSYTFIANGTPAPTYSIASGALPSGLALSSVGVLSGTPMSVGTFTFTVQATNSDGSVSSAPVTITIAPANYAPSVFSAQTPPTSGVIGTAYASYTFVANGTPAPTFSIASGALPSGLTLTTAGVLSGTPTAVGAYSFTVQASNNQGAVLSSLVTIVINNFGSQAPTIFFAQNPLWRHYAGAPYPTYTFVANGTPSPTYSIVSGSLPFGLTLSSTGVLSGIPTITGSYSFTVRASNSMGSLSSLPVTIIIDSAWMATTFPNYLGTWFLTANTIQDIVLGVNANPWPTFSIESGVLPVGLTLTADGRIIGTPTVVGTYTFTLRASNVAGSVVSAPYIFIVLPEATTVATGLGDMRHISRDNAGNIYAPIVGTGTIKKIAPDNSVTTFYSNATVSFKGGIARDKQGDFYLTAQGSGGMGKVLKISANGGTMNVLAETSTLQSALGLECDNNDNVWVAAGSAVVKIDKFGTTTSPYSHINNITWAMDIAFDTMGNIYIANAADSPGITKITSCGASTFLFNSYTPQYSYSPLWGIEVSQSGNIFVAGSSSQNIIKVLPNGTGSILARTSTPTGLLLSQDGNLIVANGFSSGSIQKIAVNGELPIEPLSIASNSPIRLTQFAPSSATAGDTVRIIGSGLTNASSVLFGTTSAQSFTVVNDTLIKAIVGGGGTGNLKVQNSASCVAEKTGFTYLNSVSAPTTFTAQSPISSMIVGTWYYYVFAANGSPAPTYSVASGTLPTGLTLISAGVLSGTPTSAGSYTFTLQASNSEGTVNSSPITITVTNPNIAPSAFTAQTPATSGAVGTTYTSYSFVANGTPAPMYSLASGTLPTGLTLSSAGVLSGTPTAAGSYTFTVQASNSAGNVNSSPITIIVTQAPSAFSAQTPATSGVVGTAFASYTFVADGTPAPTYSVASGTLPTGLTLSSAGVLSGIPTAAGSYTFTVQASNSAGSVNSASVTITVTQAPSVFSAQTPATSGIVDTAYASYTFVANGTPVPTYSVASGTLPTGLTLSSAGVLSGTPTAAGSYTFTVQASNSAGNINSLPATITVTQAPSAFSAQTPATSGAVGTAFASYVFVANGSPAPTYSVASGTLPTGLTLSSAGVLSGTPTAAGSYTFTVQAINSAGNVNSASITITVTQPTTTISSFAPASATVGNTVTIRGTGFTGASVVRFGGTAALSFVVASDTVITARVGTGASGAVSVTTPLGTASLAGFLYNVPPAPVAGSFSPMSARPGDTVVIRGVNFLSASTVSFGGVSMLYTVVSDSVIRAYISASAVSGSVNVITQGGTSNMNGFTFIPLPPAPRITSFTPNRAAEGASVVITGTNLTGATRVKF